jgi:hypothetical protein
VRIDMISTLPARAAGTAWLDRAVVSSIERDPTAMYQAVTIVVLAGLANGTSIAVNQGTGTTGVALALFGNILAWIVFAGLVYVIGSAVLPGDSTQIEASRSGVFQTIGFAQTPNLLAIAGALGVLGQVIAFTGLIWMFICAVVAASVSLRVSTARALLIALIAGIITLMALSLVGVILGQPVL